MGDLLFNKQKIELFAKVTILIKICYVFKEGCVNYFK